MRIFNWFKKQEKVEQHPVITVDDMMNISAYAGQQSQAPWEQTIWDGGKFFGGFGVTELLTPDYWTLRQRSSQLFDQNHYAKGIIGRFVTNMINTGLTPEIRPDEIILGIDEDKLAEWSEDVESRFHIWSKDPRSCDFKKQSTFGKIQRQAYREALIDGDVLVVLRQSTITRLPEVELINGSKVRTPLGSGPDSLRQGHVIIEGVELDAKRRVVAYWVDQKDDLESKRIPAFGERTKRRTAWLVFATEKRVDRVRGMPLLSIILQSLKEIERYRDSVQRKAVINSLLAMFIKKTVDKPGTRPVTGGANRKQSIVETDSTGQQRKFNIAQHNPGLVFEELQVGEEPVAFGGQGTDVNFKVFEEAILQSMAWALGIPPEILTLSFTNNYSASQAAINEFKMLLNELWSDWGETFCTPIEREWLISEILNGKIQADGLIQAWRDPMQQDIFGAWTLVDWFGSIKPSTDMRKQGLGSEILVKQGWSTNSKESRMLTGSKFSVNIKRLKRENKQKAEAARPILELEREFGVKQTIDALDNLDAKVFDLVEDALEDVKNGS